MSVLNSYKVCFLGRTGNGKSTLINALYGTKFNTDPLVSCTKELYTVTLLGNCPEGYEGVTVYDTPGIGEFSSDDAYQRFYEEAVSEANCIILVTTFDRTDAPAQRLLMKLKPFINSCNEVKFLVVLNHIDSTIVADNQNYVAWDDVNNQPSEECQKYIEERIGIIHQRFGKHMPIYSCVAVSGLRRYGVERLKSEIEK